MSKQFLKNFIFLNCIVFIGILPVVVASVDKTTLPAAAVMQEDQDGPAKFTPTPLKTGDGLLIKVLTKADSTVIRVKPKQRARIDTVIGMFRPLFVFDWQGKKEDEISKDGFYYVGDSPEAKSILGWVYKEDVVVWNHREGAVFTEQSANRDRAKIYETLVDLKKGTKGEISNVISEEPPGLTNYSKRCKMPLPILQSVGWHDPENDSHYTAYEIAYLHAGMDTSRLQVLTPRQIANKYGTADIVFVIDATISMRPYIEAVRSVVENMARRLPTINDTLTIRLGLVAYRDYDALHSDPDDYIAKRFVNLTDSVDEFLQGLRQVNEASYSNPGCPEAGFDGMIEAVANTNWSETGLRIVIVISDNSSWDESNVQQNPQRYSLDMVQILANQRRIRFLMVKIEGTCDENNDQEKHRQQCKLLANGKGPDTRGGYAEVNQGIENIPMYTAALDTFLYKEIMRTWQLMRVAIDWRKNYRPPFISSDDWAIILRNINSDLLDPNVIQPASFNTGWVLQQKVGAPANLSPTVMFDYSELSLYTYILGGFLTYIEPSSDEVLQLVIKDFEKKVGEAFPENMPIGDFLEKKTGLPIREGGLLDITPEAARNMFPEERRNLMDYLRKKKTYVDIFLSDQSNFISLGKTKYRVTFLPLDMMP